jgi:alpha-D-ribose 1-methylphosphonate 5-triphosphate synthase subunit PhnL
VAINLFLEAKKKGAAIVGIFHDKEVRDKVSDYLFELPAYADRDD